MGVLSFFSGVLSRLSDVLRKLMGGLRKRRAEFSSEKWAVYRLFCVPLQANNNMKRHVKTFNTYFER